MTTLDDTRDRRQISAFAASTNLAFRRLWPGESSAVARPQPPRLRVEADKSKTGCQFCCAERHLSGSAVAERDVGDRSGDGDSRRVRTVLGILGPACQQGLSEGSDRTDRFRQPIALEVPPEQILEGRLPASRQR